MTYKIYSPTFFMYYAHCEERSDDIQHTSLRGAQRRGNLVLSNYPAQDCHATLAMTL